MELKGSGSGSDPWQSWRVAATLGPLQRGLLGARRATFQPEALPKHFLRVTIAYSCLPDEREEQRAGGLKDALRELSQKP